MAISSVPTSSTSEPALVATCDAATPEQLSDYRAVQSLPPTADLYTVCQNGEATVFGVGADGASLAPADMTPSDQSARSEEPPPGYGCYISDELSGACDWNVNYKKISGENGAVLWSRWLQVSGSLYMYTTAFQVDVFVRSADHISIEADAYAILNRMQGVLSPTYENSVGIELAHYAGFPDSTSVGGTGYLARTTTGEGRYSIHPVISRVFDGSEGVWIPLLDGDQNFKRVQCYDDDPVWGPVQCRYPNGQEAPIL